MTEYTAPIVGLSDSIERAEATATMTSDERDRVRASMWAAYRESSAHGPDRFTTDRFDVSTSRTGSESSTAKGRRSRTAARLAAVAAVVALLVIGAAAVLSIAGPTATSPSSPTELRPLPISDDGEIRRWRFAVGELDFEFETSSTAVIADVTSVSFAIVPQRPRPSSVPTDQRIEVLVASSFFDGEEPETWFEMNGLDAVPQTPDDQARTAVAWRLFIPSARAIEFGCEAFAPCLAVASTPDGVDELKLRAATVNDLRIVEDADVGVSLGVLTHRLSYIVGSSAVLAEVDRDLFLRTLSISPHI